METKALKLGRDYIRKMRALLMDVCTLLLLMLFPVAPVSMSENTTVRLTLPFLPQAICFLEEKAKQGLLKSRSLTWAVSPTWPIGRASS